MTGYDTCRGVRNKQRHVPMRWLKRPFPHSANCCQTWR